MLKAMRGASFGLEPSNLVRPAGPDQHWSLSGRWCALPPSASPAQITQVKVGPVMVFDCLRPRTARRRLGHVQPRGSAETSDPQLTARGRQPGEMTPLGARRRPEMIRTCNARRVVNIN